MIKDQKCECDDCDWIGPESDLRCELGDIPDLCERLDPGGVVPSGECPECGALAYPVKKSVIRPKERTLETLHLHVGKLNALLADPHPGMATWVEFYGREMRWIAEFWKP